MDNNYKQAQPGSTKQFNFHRIGLLDQRKKSSLVQQDINQLKKNSFSIKNFEQLRNNNY
jgi:hypothetical protein